MYRFLLAWRYLRTRFIAVASIVSVTLGVATLIVGLTTAAAVLGPVASSLRVGWQLALVALLGVVASLATAMLML